MVTTAEVHTRVAAPPVSPQAYGLFSVAAPISPSDTGWQVGVSWESWACLDPNVTTDTCIGMPSTLAVGGIKEFEVCPDTQKFKPFTVYVGIKRAGGTVEVAQESASQVLANGEEYAAEKILWAEMLADAGALPAAVAPVLALGKVEKALAVGFRGRGVIHLDALTATVLGDHLTRSGSQLTTLLGTPVVVGSGYDFDNAHPGAIFGTGSVAVRRSGVSLISAWDTKINDELGLAERTYIVGYDCFITGQQATVTGGP